MGRREANDPWKGYINYSHAEYRDAQGRWFPSEMREQQAEIWIWREDDAQCLHEAGRDHARSRARTSGSTSRSHPVTGSLPASEERLEVSTVEDTIRAASFAGRDRIAWATTKQGAADQADSARGGDDIGTSVFYEYSDGAKQTRRLFGRQELFSTSQSTELVATTSSEQRQADSRVSTTSPAPARPATRSSI